MLKKIILTSRPLLWLAHLSSFFFGISQISSNDLNPYKIFIVIFLLTFPVSMFIYGLNDVSDYESDILNERKGGLLGLKHDKNEFNLIYFFSVLSGFIFIIFSFFSGFIPFVLSSSFVFVLGFYSMKPFRFKNIPVIDAITGGCLYSLIITLWSYSMFNGSFSSNISLNPFIFMFSV